MARLSNRRGRTPRDFSDTSALTMFSKTYASRVEPILI